MKRLFSILLGLTAAVMLLSATASAAESDLPKREAPHSLVWGNVYLDSNHGTIHGDTVIDHIDGTASFVSGSDSVPAEEYWVTYEMNVYRKDPSGDVKVLKWDFYVMYANSGCSSPIFSLMDNPVEGTYYYTVYAKGDGVNYADSDVVTSGDWYYVPPSQKAPAPYNLQWGVEYDAWGEVIDPDCPGMMSFQGPVNEHGIDTQYRLTIYRKEAGEDVYLGYVWFNWWGSTVSENFFSGDTNPPSGTYYFTVYTLGDGANILDSDIVTSPEWVYVQPDITLEATDLHWDDHFTMKWEKNVDDSSLVGNTREFLYYSQTPDSESAVLIDWDTGHQPLGSIAEQGPGYYFFSVQLWSSDLTKALNGEFSPLSPPLYCDEEAVRISKVGRILNDRAFFSLSTAQQELKSISQDLTHVLLHDTEDLWISSLLKKAEAGLKVTPLMVCDHDALDTSLWDVVGAGLHGKATQKSTQQLCVDDDTESLVDTSRFHAAIPFTMRLKTTLLETVYPDGEQLTFPYKVTMPLPETIDPAHAAVLQYSADGTSFTTACSRTFCEDDQWYIDFLPTQFGTFALVDGRPVVTEKNESDLTLSMCPPDGTTAFCAAYDANGKMLGITGFENGRGTITCRTGDVASLRCFLTDSESNPLREPISVPLN